MGEHMKRFTKIILTMLLVLVMPCLIFAGCTKDKYVVSIIKSSETTDGTVYTITYSDGTTDSMTISNGEKGADGIDGADGVDPTVVFEVRQNHNRVFNRLYACGKACAFYIVNALLQIRVGLGFVLGIKYAAGNRGCGHFAECGRNAVELVQNILCLAGLHLVGDTVEKRLIGCFKGRRVAVLELGNLIHLKGVAGLVAAHLEGCFLIPVAF